MKGQIVVYSVTGCPHCNSAKSKLKEVNLNFVEVSVDRFPAYVREWLVQRTGKTSVPQIFFNQNHIGGNQELQDLIANRSDEFKEFLKVLEENETPSEDDPLLPNPSEALDLSVQDPIDCEPDSFTPLVNEILKSRIVKDRKQGFFSSSLKNSFFGKDLVDWLVTSKSVSRQKAVEMGQQLIERKFVRAKSRSEFRDESDSLYHFISFDSFEALNTDSKSDCAQRSASEVGEDLRKLILKIFGKFLSEDGRAVDYEGIKASESFVQYKSLSRELQRVKVETLSSAEKMSFFINVYNALVIHANIERGTPENLWQRFRFFSSVSYNIGGLNFSLNDIENGILRANQGSMATLYRTPFKRSDPRLSVSLESVDARIHFALNCGAKSCPPIKTFSPEGIDHELALATQSYLETDDGFSLDESGGKVLIRISMLFKWYSSDFGNDERQILAWISNHLSPSTVNKSMLDKALYSNYFKVKYLPYDWAHNDKKK